MIDEPGYSLALAFDSDDPEFTRGIEAGRLYEMARRCPDAFEQPIHAENAEMALRIAEAVGREVSATDLDDDGRWLNLALGPAVRWLGPASRSPLDCNGCTEGTAPPDSARSVPRRSPVSRSRSARTSRQCVASPSPSVVVSRGLFARCADLIQGWLIGGEIFSGLRRMRQALRERLTYVSTNQRAGAVTAARRMSHQESTDEHPE